jgi:uncharacterized damage-inducible protein DinB
MSDLSYPIGKFAPPAEYTAAGRAAAIQEIKAAPALLRAAVRGLDEMQLLTPYREGGWTVAQVVHHLADAHVNGYVRFKWTLTEDRPPIKLYDQAAWATLPDASTAAIEDSLCLLELLHVRWVQLFDNMTPADFSREFIHPIRGPESLDRHVALYAWHGRHHTAHITTLRTRMGW